MGITRTNNRFTASFDSGVLVGRKWSSSSGRERFKRPFDGESVNMFFVLFFLVGFVVFLFCLPLVRKKPAASDFALQLETSADRVQKKNAFLPVPQFRLDTGLVTSEWTQDIVLYPLDSSAREPKQQKGKEGKDGEPLKEAAVKPVESRVVETKDGGFEVKGLKHFAQGDDDIYAESGRGWRPQGYCGPVAMQMVLDFYGVKKSRDYLALTNPDTGEVFRSDQYNGQMYIKGVGSVYSVMVKMARSLGFDLTEQAWLNGELSELAKLVKKGRPQIVSVRGVLRFTNGRKRRTGGHILLVRGFTAEGNLIINDPALHSADVQISAKNFQAIWQGFSIDINRSSALSGSNISSAR
jgi:hypothetical protein